MIPANGQETNKQTEWKKIIAATSDCKWDLNDDLTGSKHWLGHEAEVRRPQSQLWTKTIAGFCNYQLVKNKISWSYGSHLAG